MDDRKHAAVLDSLLDRAIAGVDGRLRGHVADIAAEDAASLEHLRHSLLSRLLSRSLTGIEVRRAAELLTDVEGMHRQRVRALIDSVKGDVRSVRQLYAQLPRTPPSRLPVAVSTQVCHGFGFAKSMYSAVRGQIWSPLTIAIHRDLGGFSELRRAVHGQIVPKGAAPREEGILRRPRGMAVDYADTLHDTYKPLIDLSKPQGYVVVPVVVAGRVTAILHADRDEVAIEPTDLDVLRAVSDVCGLAQETMLVRARIESQNRGIRDRLFAMQSALSDLESSRLTFAEAVDADDTETEGDRRTRVALTAHEREILDLVAQGHPNAEIARRLFVSDGTVKSRLSRIYAKLGVTTRAEAAAYRSVPGPPGTR